MSEATTPDAMEAPEVAEMADVLDQAGADAEGQDIDGEGPDDQAGAEAEDAEDIEYEGQTFRVPKVLKDAFLRNADYTQKTQEVAAKRKAVDDLHRSVTERISDVDRQIEAAEALAADFGEVHALQARVKAFEAVNWGLATQEDPAQAQALWMEFQQTKDLLSTKSQALSEKKAQRLQEQSAARTKALEETGRVLAQDIPGFNQQVASEIARFGVEEIGISTEEIPQMTDPRLWKVLHRAMTAEAELAKLKKGQAVQVQQRVKPAATVRANTSPPKALDDRTRTDDWMKARQAQLAKR